MTFADNLNRYAPHVLSLVRIVAALLFFEHGLGKLTGFPPSSMPGVFTLFWFAGVIEFVAGALLIVGLFTRTAAFIASGEMAFAYFLGHAPKAFYPMLNGGEPAILLCFIFFYMVFAGGGAWGLDNLLTARRRAGSLRAA
jgi:putative oxidoreductase